MVQHQQAASINIIRFGANDIENLITQDESRIERLPFGAIMVDSSGVVMRYNGAETDISGLSREEVIGRNFFTDIAPCTKGHPFEESFRKGVGCGAVDALFEYEFDQVISPTAVRVHMKSTNIGRGIWIFIKRL